MYIYIMCTEREREREFETYRGVKVIVIVFMYIHTLMRKLYVYDMSLICATRTLTCIITHLGDVPPFMVFHQCPKEAGNSTLW